MLDEIETENFNAALNDEDELRRKKRTFVRSEIAFPYVNLEDARAVALAMSNAGGVPMTRDQVASALGITPDTGSLSVKLNGARMFGLISSSDGKFEVTKRGYKLISSNEHESHAARVAAFLGVELYAKLVEHFKNKPLPGRAGLEAAIVSFGVSEKQKDKARQAFERSALYAEFLSPSKDRLADPRTRAGRLVQRIEDWEDHESVTSSNQSPSITTSPLEHHLIKGMLDLMPPVGTDWPMQARVKWVRTLISNLAMIYNAEDECEMQVRLPEKQATQNSPAPAKPLAAPPAPSTQERPQRKTNAWDAPASASDLDEEIPF